MNRTVAAGMQPVAVSGGMLWLVGAGLVLMQLTSLALGPAVNRQLQVSLSVPAVDMEDASGLVGPGQDTVLGAISSGGVTAGATPARVAARRQLPSLGPGRASIAPATVLIKNEPAATSPLPVLKPRGAGHDDNGVERRVGKVPARD